MTDHRFANVTPTVALIMSGASLLLNVSGLPPIMRTVGWALAAFAILLAVWVLGRQSFLRWRIPLKEAGVKYYNACDDTARNVAVGLARDPVVFGQESILIKAGEGYGAIYARRAPETRLEKLKAEEVAPLWARSDGDLGPVFGDVTWRDPHVSRLTLFRLIWRIRFGR